MESLLNRPFLKRVLSTSWFAVAVAVLVSTMVPFNASASTKVKTPKTTIPKTVTPVYPPGVSASCRSALPAPTAALGLNGWTPVGRTVSGCRAMYETAVNGVTVIWIDPRLASINLYPSSLMPGGGPYFHTTPIATGDAMNLLAAFNSGFKMGDSHGGYYADGRAESPLVNGIASAVLYNDGTMNVGTWGTEVSMTPNVIAIRQNLYLLIDNGTVNPETSTEPFAYWGITWPGGPTTNRSAIGITANGGQLYAGGTSLTVSQITQALAASGAMRAMELDQNSTLPDFSGFTPALNQPASPSNGASLIPGFAGPQRYFETGWNRDFFAVLARSSATGAATGNGSIIGRRRGENPTDFLRLS